MIHMIVTCLQKHAGRACLLPLLHFATATAFAGMPLSAYDSTETPANSHTLIVDRVTVAPEREKARLAQPQTVPRLMQALGFSVTSGIWTEPTL